MAKRKQTKEEAAPGRLRPDGDHDACWQPLHRAAA